MKKILTLFVLAAAMIMISSCEKDDETAKIIVTLGAQESILYGGFYSVADNKVYNQADAYDHQTTVDILCFYEAEGGNNIALASPGSGITGIFTGDEAPEFWSNQKTTWFLNTTLTAAQFDALAETDQLIVTSFVENDSGRKAKDMQPGLVVSFKTQDATYGLLKVTEVTQGATGSVKFEVKIKK